MMLKMMSWMLIVTLISMLFNFVLNVLCNTIWWIQLLDVIDSSILILDLHDDWPVVYLESMLICCWGWSCCIECCNYVFILWLRMIECWDLPELRQFSNQLYCPSLSTIVDWCVLLTVMRIESWCWMSILRLCINKCWNLFWWQRSLIWCNIFMIELQSSYYIDDLWRNCWLGCAAVASWSLILGTVCCCCVLLLLLWQMMECTVNAIFINFLDMITQFYVQFDWILNPLMIILYCGSLYTFVDWYVLLCFAFEFWWVMVAKTSTFFQKIHTWPILTIVELLKSPDSYLHNGISYVLSYGLVVLRYQVHVWVSGLKFLKLPINKSIWYLHLHHVQFHRQIEFKKTEVG